MKRLSVVLLILVLVAGSVFAAMTPEFSGKFRFGYKFAFGEHVNDLKDYEGNKASIGPWKLPGELKLKIEFGTDVWKIALKNWNPDDNQGKLDSDDKISANLTFNIDKVVDMGDHKLAVNMGANDKMTALSAYNDVTDPIDYGGQYKFKNAGKYTFEARYGYADIVNVNLTIDPTKGDDGDIRSFMISAKGKIVDGVTLAAQYGFHPALTSNTGERTLKLLSDVTGQSTPNPVATAGKNGFGASLGIDIAKLANLDFMLKFSAYDNFAADKYKNDAGDDVKANFNNFTANVQGGVDAVNGYVEFGIETAKDGDEKKNYTNLAVGVNVGVVEDLPFKVYFLMNDMGNVTELRNFRVGADVQYKVVGLDLGYTKFAKIGDDDKFGAFTITPRMQVSF